MFPLVSLIIYLLLFVFFSVLFFYFFRGAVFVPTPQPKVKIILDLAEIKPGMRVADLGSGDGRIVIAAAKAGALAHGYEINPLLVWWSRRKIKALGLSEQAFIHWGDFWNVNFSSFDVVVVYGIDFIMGRLEKKLSRELKKEAKVISYAFPFPTFKLSRKESSVLLYAPLS